MNKAFGSLLLYVATAALAKAQIAPDYIGPQATGMAGVSVANKNMWSLFNNPAAMAYTEKTETGITHQMLYSGSGLAHSGFGLVTPVKGSVIGGGINYWGYPYFRNTQAALAFGKLLGDRFSAGINLAYARFSLGDAFYGSRVYLKSGIGIMAKLPSNLSVGVFLQNIHRPRISSVKDTRDQPFIKAGIAYKPTENIIINAEATQQLNHKLIIRVGMEYIYKQQFYIRTGVSDNRQYGMFSLGAGQKIKTLSWHVGSQWHPLLGLSPAAGLQYAFK